MCSSSIFIDFSLCFRDALCLASLSLVRKCAIRTQVNVLLPFKCLAARRTESLSTTELSTTFNGRALPVWRPILMHATGMLLTLSLLIDCRRLESPASYLLNQIK